MIRECFLVVLIILFIIRFLVIVVIVAAATVVRSPYYWEIRLGGLCRCGIVLRRREWCVVRLVGLGFGREFFGLEFELLFLLGLVFRIE